MTQSKLKVYAPPGKIERSDCKPIAEGYINEVEKHFTNATSTQIGVMIAKLIDLTTVVCYRMGDDSAYHIGSISIIDDAVHLIIDLKEPF